MNLTMDDCIRFMENSFSFQLGARQVARDESYKRDTTSCSSSGRSTSSSVPSVQSQPPNNPHGANTSQDLTLGGSYEWATGQEFYTPRVEAGATTSQYQQGGNEFTALLTESEPNIVYDTQFAPQ
ncbi:uncharacterized protein LOC113333287 [Papaver somniferum]|uniref:uncharacterized protein LOC113333287 n=1 Tax=Papaver somniferum TaxID=3469 RepID=UPI000E701138|nr:uncharacterized protein LOC113333287 [Papaver somniferum]